MYEIIYNIISHAWETGSSEQQYIMYTCSALIIVLTCVFIDIIYRIFSHFWRG